MPLRLLSRGAQQVLLSYLRAFSALQGIPVRPLKEPLKERRSAAEPTLAEA
jgi:hypothetical protein